MVFIHLSLIFKLLLVSAHSHLGGKRQLERVSSLLPPWGPGDQTRVVSLGSKCLRYYTLAFAF